MPRWLASLVLATLACDPDAPRAEPPEPEPQVDARRGDGADDRLLRHVPADTPFVFATTTPLSQRTIDRIDPLIELFTASIDRELAAASDDGSPELTALASSLHGRLDARGLRELGIDANPRWVAYGLGPAPIVRVELADGEAFTRWLASIDRADGVTELRTQGGAVTWTLGELDDEVAVAVAVDGNALVLGVFPGRAQTAVLAHMIGHDMPRRSLVDSRWLDTARSDHDFLPQFLGTVDLARFAALFAGEGDPLALEVFRAWVPDARPDECTPAWRGLLGDAPRIWFGLRELDASDVRWASVWELAAPLRRELRDVAAPIAGIGRDGVDVGAAGFAVGIDVVQARAAAVRIVERHGLAGCTEVDEALGVTLPSWLVGVHSLSVVVDRWRGGVESASGVAVLGVDDPAAWLSALAPTANTKALRRRAAPLGQVLGTGEALGPDLWIAAGNDALGVARGDGARRDLQRAVRIDRDDHQTWAAWSVDVPKLLAEVGARDRSRALDWASSSPDALAAELTKAIGRWSGHIVLTDDGLELEGGFEIRR